MSKKSDTFYFDNFRECAAISCDAAKALESALRNFDIKKIDNSIAVMHEIEHKGDEKKHIMMNELVKAFITPIERDDIIDLSQTIDDVTDAIDDILMRIYMTETVEIRKDSLAFAEHIIRCCEAMKCLLDEFVNFKKSKKLPELIIEINKLEEDGDKLYVAAMKKLHHESTSPFDVIVWREIYTYFENVCDACEDVADIVEGIVIGNS